MKLEVPSDQDPDPSRLKNNVLKSSLVNVANC